MEEMKLEELKTRLNLLGLKMIELVSESKESLEYLRETLQGGIYELWLLDLNL